MKLHMVRGEAAPEDANLVFKGLVKIKEEANLYNIVADPKRWKSPKAGSSSTISAFPRRPPKAPI